MVSAQKANLAGPIVRIDGEHMLNCKCDHNPLFDDTRSTGATSKADRGPVLGDFPLAWGLPPLQASKVSREAAAMASHRQQRQVDDVVNLQKG
jgi:hypothetical protein